jgi:hypothetical protein
MGRHSVQEHRSLQDPLPFHSMGPWRHLLDAALSS